MTSILCLAHYCDTHGPTPLMVTEGLSVGCSSCFDEDSLTTRRPSTSSRSKNTPSGPSRAFAGRRTTSSASEGEGGARRAELRTSGDGFSSAIETPPESPRLPHLHSQHENSPRRDSSFRRTYDENDKKRAIACENCALTLPKRTKDVSLSATSETPRRSSRVDTNSPILRTRIPYERIAVPVDASPPKSPDDSGDLDNTDRSSKAQARRHSQGTASAVVTSSSNSSFGSTTTHTHHIDYNSTHEPLSPNSFSIVRQSCLRTLSCETLPPNTTSTANNPSIIPSSPFINNPFCQSPTSSTSSTSSTASTSGGPIFFGDPLAGYTTAYIFRIPDPNARGRRRVYALMALSTHHERLAMKSFSFLGSTFRELAAWIQGLAEMELERTESMQSPRADSGIGMSSSGMGSSGLSSGSFLSGRSRGPDGKFAGVSLRARGLAELVGLPDFFLELHARFVRLLVELNVLLGA